MIISYNVTLKSTEVKLISEFMKQEKFTLNCVDEFYSEYGLKLGGEILKMLKIDRNLCKNDFDNKLTSHLIGK